MKLISSWKTAIRSAIEEFAIISQKPSTDSYPEPL
jgi:hypothetical protein